MENPNSRLAAFGRTSLPRFTAACQSQGQRLYAKQVPENRPAPARRATSVLFLGGDHIDRISALVWSGIRHAFVRLPPARQRKHVGAQLSDKPTGVRTMLNTTKIALSAALIAAASS